MKEIINISSGELILSKNEFGPQQVINDFKNSNEIYIVTWNLDIAMLKEILNNLSESQSLHLVTNYPSPRDASKEQMLKLISFKNDLLNLVPKSKFYPYFCNSNHSKILLTDNICYIGSSNFSKASRYNFECGVLIRDKSSLCTIKGYVDKIVKDSEFLKINGFFVCGYEVKK